MSRRLPIGAGALALVLSGCATLALTPPRFQVEEDRGVRLVLLGPSPQRPLGGVSLQLWTRVENPNAVGLTVASLDGDLLLDGTRAATVTLPLGVPLPARGDTIVPVETAFSFADFPTLAGVAARFAVGQTVSYEVDGIVTVDAGALGRPSFGPRTWLRGSASVGR